MSVSNVVAQDAQNIGLSVTEVIYNPLNIGEIERASKLFTPKINRPYIVFVGRIVTYKGIHELLQAFAALSVDIDLVYVGDGSAIKTLRIAVHTLGLQNRVHFTGLLNNPYPWIRHAKLLVLPSITEAMGYVAVEACALGCRIVVSGYPAAHEFFVEDVIVSLSPVGNYIERLAEKISAGLTGKLPPGLKPDVLEKMDPRCVAEKYLALVDKRIDNI
ncbi:MAG: glycosyltransferase [Zoogloeaceae bacterium]|nr:glycosyltransferase [Zoogloeaceae bacterium]